MSAPQRTPRTANISGNILPCFAPLNDRGDQTNQLQLLEFLHTSYISLLNHVWEGRVFYSVDKCFEAGADPRNIVNKKFVKKLDVMSPVYCVIPRATLA